MVLKPNIPECYLGLFESLFKPPPHMINNDNVDGISSGDTSPSNQNIFLVSSINSSNIYANNGTARNTNNNDTIFNLTGTGGDGGDEQNLNNIYYAYVIGPVLLVFIIASNIMLIYGQLASHQRRGHSGHRYSSKKRNKRKLTLTSKLFIYHSATDLIAGFLVIPIQMTAHFRHGYVCWYLSLAVSLTVFSQCTGINTLLTISFLRYLSIKRPLMMIKAKWVLAVLVLQSVIAAVIAVYTFLVYFGRSTAHTIAGNFIMTFIYISLSSCTLVFCNIKSYFALAKQQKSLSQYSGKNRSSSKRNAKAVTTLAIITCFYVLCTVPYAIYSAVLGAYLHSPNADLRRYFEYVSWFVYIQALYLLNCGLTAAIYVSRNTASLKSWRTTVKSSNSKSIDDNEIAVVSFYSTH